MKWLSHSFTHHMNEIRIANIDIAEALYYMGFRGNMPDSAFMAAVKRCEAALLPLLTPRYVMKIAPINEITDTLLRGNDIKSFLADSEKAVFFCVTLGTGVDRHIDYTGVLSPSDALITDALANAAVEQVCDRVERIIEETYPEYSHTERYSPGYGDFPLEVQPEILAFLDAEKRIGVKAGESLMMSPLKSVSAVLGIKHK
jgi:5-methyltetrahydrofolate--homocysteine methyltransferase